MEYYYDTGALEEETNYLEGKCEGEVVEYYEDGQLSSRTFIRTTSPIAITLHNHENGKTKAIGVSRMVFAEANGTSIIHRGNSQTSITFVKGKDNGQFITYFPDGTDQHRN